MDNRVGNQDIEAESSKVKGLSRASLDAARSSGEAFNRLAAVSGFRRYVNQVIAYEVSRITRYFDRLVQWQPRHEDTGTLYDAIDCSEKSVANTLFEIPLSTDNKESRLALLINGNVNHDHDIEGTLRKLRVRLDRRARVLLVAYNPYFSWLYKLANLVGIRRGEQPTTFLTHQSLANIAKLSGYEVVRSRPCAYCPFHAFGLGDILNRLLVAIPVLRWLSLVSVITLRPVEKEQTRPSLSIVIPARNEKGNIENALKRMPDFDGADIEIIFVEGHSSDGTWEEIQRVCEKYRANFQLKAFQQTGKGKADAVRLGFSKADKELLTILDADLTMPPELLDRFYFAYCNGLADFINGSRLVYPMEGEAMRFLNHLGNMFFARALSFVLDNPLGDSLCGTKLVTRDDYARMTRWREDFGDFDPFGDFELLFPASTMALGTIDIPIRYRDRTYGSTNISRFRHGILLFRMTGIGLMKIKLGALSYLGTKVGARVSEANLKYGA